MKPLHSKVTPHRVNKRRISSYKHAKSKSKESIDSVDSKRALRCSLLNVDGLSESSLENIENVVGSEKPDVVFILETKRRVEECGIDISIPGYSLIESRRSNNADDCEGGGIAVYTKLGDGIIFNQHKPDIPDQTRAFVNSERVWITVDSQSKKNSHLWVVSWVPIL